MAEKETKKTVAVSIRRERRSLPKIIVTTGFKLRVDKATGLVDVYLEAIGQKGDRVTLDPALIQSNLEMFKQYSARLAVDPDDSALKDDVTVSEQMYFSNVLHCSNSGVRAETIFGVFSAADLHEAKRS